MADQPDGLKQKFVKIKALNKQGEIDRSPSIRYQIPDSKTILDLKKEIHDKEGYKINDITIFSKKEKPFKVLEDEEKIADFQGNLLIQFPQKSMLSSEIQVKSQVENPEKIVVLVGSTSKFVPYILNFGKEQYLEIPYGRLKGVKGKIAIPDEFDSNREVFRAQQYILKEDWDLIITMETKTYVKSDKMPEITTRILKLNREQNGELQKLEGTLKNYPERNCKYELKNSMPNVKSVLNFVTKVVKG